MFSYYGSKSKIVKYYPKPRYNKIIEPFAGSARYSLRFWEKDILLVDKDKRIIDAWHYLQQASEYDIKSLPKPKHYESLKNYDLSHGELSFMMFIVAQGSTGRYTMTMMGHRDFDYNINKTIENLHKIKYWEIINDSYHNIENQTATWFIDPPYQYGGHEYRENKIDFSKLASWSKSRHGHVIVCENTKADWMDFKPMVEMFGNCHKTTEAIWSNLKTAYDNEQTSLDI